MIRKCGHWKGVAGLLGQCALGVVPGHINPFTCSTCAEYDGPSRGLGDTIHRVAKKFVKRPCVNCEKRRQKLNKLLPYPDGV